MVYEWVNKRVAVSSKHWFQQEHTGIWHTQYNRVNHDCSLSLCLSWTEAIIRLWFKQTMEEAKGQIRQWDKLVKIFTDFFVLSYFLPIKIYFYCPYGHKNKNKNIIGLFLGLSWHWLFPKYGHGHWWKQSA